MAFTSIVVVEYSSSILWYLTTRDDPVLAMVIGYQAQVSLTVSSILELLVILLAQIPVRITALLVAVKFRRANV